MLNFFRSFYRYRPGVPDGSIGVGVGGLGFVKPQSDPLYQPVPRNRAVRGQLGPLEGAAMVTVQTVTPVSLTGNGAQLTGSMALQALSQFQGGKS